MAESLSARLRQRIADHAGAGRTALLGAEHVSYADLGLLIDAFAAGVSAWGVGRSETVGVIAPKTAAAIAAGFGAMQAGACVGFIDPGLSPDAVAEQADAAAMRRVIVDADLMARLDDTSLRGLMLRSLPTLNHGGSFADHGLGTDDPAMLLFTSGSTGRPKGVLLRHGNLLCNASGVLGHTGTSPHDRLLHVMPLYHTNGLNNQLIVPFLAGASVVLVPRFSPGGAVEALRRDAPTYMTAVPTMYARMLPHVVPGERFPSLRFLRCGSAPITPELHHEVEAAFGAPLVVSYGLSEATCTSTMNPLDRRKIGTVGTVLAGQRVGIFDPGSNAAVAAGGEGEIRIAGPALMAGYLGSREQPIVDGWLRTGDIGRFDDEGFLVITGRLKDVIIRGGENISPALIERTLAAHPAVRECCVVGAPHKELGEVPVAFVVLTGASACGERDLKMFVEHSLARSYVPASVRTVDVLPTNAAGKVDRKALRHLAATTVG